MRKGLMMTLLGVVILTGGVLLALRALASSDDSRKKPQGRSVDGAYSSVLALSEQAPSPGRVLVPPMEFVDSASVPPAGDSLSIDKVDPAPDWREVYAQFTLGETIDEIATLRARLNETTEPYYRDALATGAFEIIAFYSPGEKVSVPTENFDELCRVAFLNDGRVVRTVLPRDQFPDAYVMQEQVQYLMEQEEQLKHGRPMSAEQVRQRLEWMEEQKRAQSSSQPR